MILITGAAGFIGSNVTHLLLENGFDVLPLDNGFLGSASNLPEMIQRKFRYLTIDITNKKDLRHVNRYKIDAIVHLAAYSSAPMFDPDPTRGMEVNVEGFSNILEVARKQDSKVIYASTSSLYSNSKSFREDTRVNPNTYYEYTKYVNELTAALYENYYGLNVVGLRFFSVYGYNELHKGRFANLVSQFIWDMEKGKQPIVYGDGTQSRDFTWAGDVAEVIRILLTKRTKSTIFNVGTGVSYSLNHLISIINGIMGRLIQPTYISNPIKRYVKRTQSDTELLKKEVGYVPNTTIRAGIKRLLKRKNLNTMND